MAGRFSVVVQDAMEALLSDSTAGIGARCSAVNAIMGDSKYDLPTTWQAMSTQQIAAKPRFPYYEMFTLGVRTKQPFTNVGTGVYEVQCQINLWISALTTRSNPAVAAEQYRRMEWAALEMVIERDDGIGGRWSGRTLLGKVQDLYDERIIPVKLLPSMNRGKEGTGGIGAQMTFTVEICEEDLSTG